MSDRERTNTDPEEIPTLSEYLHRYAVVEGDPDTSNLLMQAATEAAQLEAEIERLRADRDDLRSTLKVIELWSARAPDYENWVREMQAVAARAWLRTDPDRARP